VWSAGVEVIGLAARQRGVHLSSEWLAAIVPVAVTAGTFFGRAFTARDRLRRRYAEDVTKVRDRVRAALVLPANPRVGQRWTQVFHVGSLPVHGTNRVLRREQVTVAGRTLDTLVIRSDSVTGGAHAGTEHDVAWHAPGLGLDVRQTISRRIGGAFPYRLEASATLAQLSPSR